MFKRSIPVLAVIIVMYATWYFNKGNRDILRSDISYIDLPESDTAFGGLFATPQINDSLPHYVYIRIKDSLEKIKKEKDLENNGDLVDGSSMGVIGVYTMSKRTGHERDLHSDSVDKLYFVGLKGYKLNDDTKFFIQNGAYKLAYPKWDTIEKIIVGGVHRVGHYEQKLIPVRYSTELKALLIPVSKQQYQFIYFVVFTAGITVIVAVYFCIGYFIQVLIRISKGNAFDSRNIRRFNMMALFLFLWPLVRILVHIIFWLVFKNTIPDDFEKPSFLPDSDSSLPWFIAAIAIFIIGKAFKKGYKLQQEQDLTI